MATLAILFFCIDSIGLIDSSIMDEASEPATKPNILKGTALALTAFFFMALFGILTKLALKSSTFVWTSFIAYFTATLVLTPYIAYRGLGYLKSRHYGLLLGRAVFGTLASFLYTVSIHFIPIVNGTLLFNTAPIFIPLLCVLFLHAHIPKAIWWAVALGFVGIIIIIQPTAAIFTETGNMLGLLSGFFLAVAYLLMKILTDTDPGIRIIFYYLGLGTILQAPFLFLFETPDKSGVVYALWSGIALLCAQISLVNAYRFAKAAEIGVYQYSSVVIVGLMDWMIWGVIPSPWDALGVALVTLAGILIIRGHDSNKAVNNNI